MPYFSIAEPIDAEAEGKALPLVRIEPAGGDHLAVDHAAAEQLHPAIGPPPITRRALLEL